MKKILFILITVALGCISCGVVKAPTSKLVGDLKAYKYVYVTPMSGVVSGAGSQGNFYVLTASPTEKISGHLMQLGYTILPAVDLDLAASTMVVTCGYTNEDLSSGIILQFRDAKSHELVAEYEAAGDGHRAQDVSNAVDRALQMFDYSFNPKVDIEDVLVTSYCITMYVVNKTPNTINHVSLRMKYLRGETLLHEQIVEVDETISVGGTTRVYVDRDKAFRDKDLTVLQEIVAYK